MSNKVGTRIIYDNDGEIVAILSEMEGAVLARKENVTLHYVDVAFGAIDFATTIITGVDVQTKELVLQVHEAPETEEQMRIRELEDLLLLQAENTIGGLM